MGTRRVAGLGGGVFATQEAELYGQKRGSASFGYEVWREETFGRESGWVGDSASAEGAPQERW